MEIEEAIGIRGKRMDTLRVQYARGAKDNCKSCYGRGYMTTVEDIRLSEKDKITVKTPIPCGHCCAKHSEYPDIRDTVLALVKSWSVQQSESAPSIEAESAPVVQSESAPVVESQS